MRFQQNPVFSMSKTILICQFASFRCHSISYTSQNLRKFLSSVSIRLTSSFDNCFAISIEARFSFIRVSFSVFVTTARPFARAYPMHTWAAVHPILVASFVITGSSNTKEIKWYFYFPTRYITISAISSRPSYLDYIPCVATPSWGPPTKVFVVPLPTGPYAWAIMLFSLHTANISLSFIYGLNSNSLTTGTMLHLKIYMCTALKQFFFLNSY